MRSDSVITTAAGRTLNLLPDRRNLGPTALVRVLFTSLLVMVLPRASAGQAVVHVESPSRWSGQRVSNAALAERIRNAAATYRSYAPVPRAAFFDAAYPHDSAEFVAMHGYALVVVTALAQDSTELPLSRVYVNTPGGEASLTMLFAVRSVLGEGDTLERTTFGRFRVDALYVVPVVSGSIDLLADFAAHRRGFRLGQLGRNLPKSVQRLLRGTTSARLPGREVVAAMLRREYPDLAQFLAAGVDAR